MDVGVRELKQHLSDYLERAANGETIRVTDRGRPKVLLSPISDEGSLQRGVENGCIRPAQRQGLAVARRYSSTKRSGAVLAEDRGE